MNIAVIRTVVILKKVSRPEYPQKYVINKTGRNRDCSFLIGG